MMPVMGGLDTGMNEHVMKHIEVEKIKKSYIKYYISNKKVSEGMNHSGTFFEKNGDIYSLKNEKSGKAS